MPASLYIDITDERYFPRPSFHAIADGVTDCAPAINAAINTARANGGGTIYIPGGKYLVASPINLTGFTNNAGTRGQIHLTGDGAYASQLLSTVSGKPVLDCTGSTLLRLSNFSVLTQSNISSELLLLARDNTGGSAGHHLIEHMWLEGSCSHALITCLGSEQNLFNHVLGIADLSDGPVFSGCMTSSTPPGGNGTAAGWTPSSPFTTIGTGDGGNGANHFIDCDFERPSTASTTRSLVYLWGMQVPSFQGCFFACRNTTIDMRAIPHPSNPSAYWTSSGSFDSCFDENTFAEAKNTILFSSPGTSSTPSITGCHIRNCAFMTIQGDDNTWIDDFELSGGTTGYMIGATISSKLSVWRLENARIFPSSSERGYTYTVRNQGSGIVAGSLPNGSFVNTAGATYSYLDTTFLAHRSYGFLADAFSIGIGYITGAGGSVTQLTSKSTGVSVATMCGQITMNNATLNAGTTVGFTLTSTYLHAADVLCVAIKSGASANSYTLTVSSIAAGSATIELRNTSASNLSEAVVINFVIIRGATS